MRQSSNKTLRNCSSTGEITTGEIPDYLTREEVQRAMAGETRPLVRLLLGFLWITGARVSEALGARVGDIDYRLRVVSLVTLKRRRPTKRTVPLPPAFLGEIATVIAGEGLAAEEHLFAWSRSRAFEVVRDALMRAGIDRPKCHPHAFRHGHAIHALEGGAPLNVLQRVLGHSTIATTSIYLQATARDVSRFYDKMTW